MATLMEELTWNTPNQSSPSRLEPGSNYRIPAGAGMRHALCSMQNGSGIAAAIVVALQGALDLLGKGVVLS